MNLTKKSPIICDEEGLLTIDGTRVMDSDVGHEFFRNLELNKKCFFTTSIAGEPYIVHPFDEPLIAKALRTQADNSLILTGPYETQFIVDLSSLTLDEWDRVHGYASFHDIAKDQQPLQAVTSSPQIARIPFVLNRVAQDQLFDLADEVNDESVLIFGKEFPTPSYLEQFSACGNVQKNEFWNEIYLKEENPGWNLGVASPAFVDMTPRLKLPKSRILVLGSGEGHDAAFFAREGGHIVTAVDFSEDAIRRSKELYGHLSNLTFLQLDIFKLPPEFDHSFDIVVEHTCYCAISPLERAKLAALWSRLLAPRGMLMGLFFTMEKRQGPPFGSTEWEVRERLRKNFRFLFWTRWNKSVEGRANLETFVLAQKFN